MSFEYDFWSQFILEAKSAASIERIRKLFETLPEHMRTHLDESECLRKIPNEWVLNETEMEDFKCGVCYDIMFPPCAFACGHAVCEACFDRLQVHKCPKCNYRPTYVNRIPSYCHMDEFWAQMILSKAKIKCVFKCTFVGNYFDFFRHLKVCENRFVQCRCDQWVLPANLHVHEQECTQICADCGNTKFGSGAHIDCPNSLITCTECELSIARQLMAEHAEQCRKFPCPECGIGVTKFNVDYHVRTVCVRACKDCLDEMPGTDSLQDHKCSDEEVTCPYHICGCGFRLHKYDLGSHLQADMIRHGRMMIELASTRRFRHVLNNQFSLFRRNAGE